MNDMSTPDLSGNFPKIDTGLKISRDLDNPAHPPHYDVIAAIPGGVDKTRVSSTGDVIDGTTQIGKATMDR